MSGSKKDNFEDAFSGGLAGCRMTCNCGREFFDDDGDAWDWSDGELERLRTTATPLDYAPRLLVIEGKDYVDACSCWNERARQIMNFLDSNAHAIASYLSLEKKRKEAEANASPVVK